VEKAYLKLNIGLSNILLASTATSYLLSLRYLRANSL